MRKRAKPKEEIFKRLDEIRERIKAIDKERRSLSIERPMKGPRFILTKEVVKVFLPINQRAKRTIRTLWEDR